MAEDTDRPTPPTRTLSRGRLAGPLVGLAGGLAWLLAAAPVAAHSGSPPPAPTLPGVLFLWSFDPTIVLPLALAAAGYLWAVRSVDAAHPHTPVPRKRIVAWLAGLI
ncbi:MAG TPA: hypothetical protein VKR24_06505, partial [Candidatus Limnocylindrales bacterium]|nr:hypothetical protein [Candidatus Limnocylindrales bacterium]